MGFVTVLYFVFYEVERCKFIMTVCGSDCRKGGTSSHYQVVTSSVTHPVVIVSCFLGASC